VLNKHSGTVRGWPTGGGWLIVIVDVGRERADSSGSRRRKLFGLGGWPVVGLAEGCLRAFGGSSTTGKTYLYFLL